MKTPQIVLFGDSHVYAVERAIYHRNFKKRPIPLTPYRQLKIKGGKQLGDLSFDAFLTLIKGLGPDDVVLSMLGGNQHSVYSLVQHPLPFDFFEPGAGNDVEKGSHVIPYRLLERVFAEGIRNSDGQGIARLRRSTAARVVHIVPPPPKADSTYIRQHHETVFAENILAQGVSPASLRLKFWKLQTRILEALCRAAKVEVLLPPAIALDKDGFLAPKFYANDATHANSAYGEAILTEVEQLFTSVGAWQATG
jgi:hypothetical protein